jgi:hypothetical protein
MTHIGIIGAGIAGLHLGLFLRQQGVAATIYTERTAAQQLNGRLSNIVVRSAPTRARERMIGVNHWDNPETDLWRLSVYIGGERPLAFSGCFDQPAQVVDMRMYWACLLEDFAARGGQVVLGTLQAAELAPLSEQHDLVVVAAGRDRLTNIFPCLPELCPYDRPQRLVLAGLFRGIAPPQPHGFEINITPGHGEIIVLPTISFEPGLTGIGIEIIAGGMFDPLRGLRYDDDPHYFDATVLELLHGYAPAVYARTDPTAFGLARPLDHTFTAITPATRRGYTRLPNGRHVIALGDVHVLMDPLTGQGANKASHAAWALGEIICEGQGFDEAFCQEAERRMMVYAGPVAASCNARLQPPPPHVLTLMGAAARNQAIADAYADGFNHPDHFWEIVSSPEHTAAFLSQFDDATGRPAAQAA